MDNYVGFVRASFNRDPSDLTRWYRYPVHLRSIILAVLETCWCCRVDRGTMLHFWWGCPEVRPFWDTALNNYSLSVGGQLLILLRARCSPFCQALLGLKRTIYCLKVAWSIIVCRRCSSFTPTIREWQQEMSYLCSMEELSAEYLGDNKKLFFVLQRWLTFRDSLFQFLTGLFFCC